MIRLALAILFWGWLAASPVAAGPLDKLTFYTEHYPPNQYQAEGRLKGALVEVVVAMFQRADTQLTRRDIKLVPWSRGYARTKNQPNSVLFGTVRTAEREDQFKWVGPLAPTAQVIIGAKAAAHEPDSLSYFRDHTTVTIRNDVAEQLLLDKGLDQANLLSLHDSELIPRILASDRAQFWAYGERVAFHILGKHGMADAYETVWTLQEGALYFAVNPETDPAAIAALRNALEAVKRSGEHADILAAYP
jgi:polar amino acid transport system substrate-binding protein